MLNYNEVIGQSYRLESLIGRGGMAFVFQGVHTTLGSQYAIKVLATEDLTQVARQRFEAEARAIAHMNHPNIVKVHNMGLDGGDTPFYVMDLLDGEPLSDFIHKNDIDFPTALEILRQVAVGLSYAHSKGIIHRDIKPSNIFLVKQSTDHNFVKIVDFGIAKITSQARANLLEQTKTAAGEIMGSPLYMSPEQTQGLAIDQRSDIYSLGCTFYELLTGKVPYLGKTAFETMLMHQTAPLPAVPDHVSDEGCELLSRMMAKKPEARYQSLDQLLYDIDRIRAGKPIGRMASLEQDFESEVDSNEKSDRFFENKPLLAAAVTIISLVAIGFSYILMTRPLQTQPVVAQKAVELNPEHELKDALKLPATQTKSDLPHAPIYSRLIEQDGKKMRRFYIGPDRIGDISKAWDNKLNFFGDRTSYPAVNTVTIPMEKFSSLKIDLNNHPEIAGNLSAIKAINKDEFFSLYIIGNVYAEFEDTGEKNQEYKKFIKDVLKVASGWTNLNCVTLDRTCVEDDDLSVLDSCKKLTVLGFTSPREMTPRLKNHPVFDRARMLNLGLLDPTPFLPVIKDLKDLDTLGLCRPASVADLSKLSLPKKVQHINLAGVYFDQKMADKILGQPTLDSILVDECSVDIEAIKRLLTRKDLRYLQVDQASYDKLRKAGIYDRRLGAKKAQQELF